jgi:proton-dependent oligopeptide transporter, POT family
MSQGLTQVAGDKERHPKGLYVLFLTEMWERFSFYLMIGIFYLYMTDSQTGGMGWSGTKAASITGSYIGAVYFTPFLGGLIADRLLGYRKTVFLGGLSFIIGHVVLAIPEAWALYTALVFLVIGNGLFKPNISTMVGRLYPEGSALRDRAYTIFYMGINIGAFACNFVAAVVRNKYGWHWAFATAGFGMALGLVIFALGQKYIRHADLSREEIAAPKESLRPLWIECLGPALAAGILGWLIAPSVGPLADLGQPTTAFIFGCIPVVWFYLRMWLSIRDKGERGRVGALLTIFGVVIVFWMVFHQNSTALTEFAEANTDRRPSALIQPIVDLAPDFAQDAPPEYFYNADPGTPRPDPSVFRVVGDDEYAALKELKKVGLQAGVWVVTQAELDQVYERAGPDTPKMAPDETLKLVNTELFQSINGGFVIILAPLMVGLWALLNRRGLEPSNAAKIATGLLITGLSAVVMIGAVAAAGTPEAKVSAWWLFGTYFVITVGELCLSPIGLSMVSKLAPRRLAGFLMGGWFLSTSIGNKLSGVLGEMYHTWDHTNFFIFNTVAAGAAAAIIFALLPWLRRQMSTTPPVDPPAGDLVSEDK